jgi:hypothetical protein
MNENHWCPRARLLLKGQLRSNDTLLLKAYHAYQGSRRSDNGHVDCDKFKCVTKTLVYGGEHAPLCVPGCEHQNEEGGYERVGPSMDAVRQVLEGDGSHRGSGIPFLRFSNNDNEDQSRSAVGYPPMNKGDRSFATISHVWSDNWAGWPYTTLHPLGLLV